jgi:dsDNA-specific endonuclease/ATPase MutS2
MSDDIEQLTSERDRLRAELDGEGTRLMQCRAQVESLSAELSKFHEAMQRERKADWEKWHMDLADHVEMMFPSCKQCTEAARELRYMATDFTLKANFVPTDLEIKALKEKVESLSSTLSQRMEQARQERVKLRDLLRYVTYFRLPGDTVFDKLDFERQKLITTTINDEH